MPTAVLNLPKSSFNHLSPSIPMKSKNLLTLFTALSAVGLGVIAVSCARNHTSPSVQDDVRLHEQTHNQDGDTPRIANRKAYERGLAVGNVIATLEDGSREREKALIDAHGMASALLRCGYRQSATDFSRGLNDALK